MSPQTRHAGAFGEHRALQHLDRLSVQKTCAAARYEHADHEDG